MKIATLVFLLGTTVLAGSAFAADRQDVVSKSTNLQDVSMDLAQMLEQQCGCPNSARTLYDIAEIGQDVELAARFSTVQEATGHLRDVIRKVKDLKGYVAHIADRSIRLRVKRDAVIAVNDLGRAVMGNNWIFVSAAPAQGPGEEETVANVHLNAIDLNLNQQPESSF